VGIAVGVGLGVDVAVTTTNVAVGVGLGVDVAVGVGLGVDVGVAVGAMISRASSNSPWGPSGLITSTLHVPGSASLRSKVQHTLRPA
jgi:hypothetical protein